MRDILRLDSIQNQIHLIRGHRVLLHTELARLYGVPPSRLLTQAERFPGNFCFQLERIEVLNFTEERFDDRQRLHAFTEHGALVVAYLIDTPAVIAASGAVVCAFVHLRQAHSTPAPSMNPEFRWRPVTREYQ